MTTATVEYTPGQLVRTLSRTGLWQVVEVDHGRVKCRPIGDVWVRTERWFSESEIVRARA